jgi:ATP-dependent Clp protease ATP-binding subunit ClpC
MFERFTDRARRTIVQAQEESRALHHTYIGPEHILLALMHEGGGLGRRVLTELGITEERVRDQLGLTMDPEVESPPGHIPFTPQAKKTLELSLREALQLSDSHIGTEHILLGLIRQDEGRAAQALQELGADLETARAQMLALRPEVFGEVRVAQRPRAGEGLGEGLDEGLDEARRAEAVQAENETLRQEVSRLRELLQRHSIDPDEDSA